MSTKTERKEVLISGNNFNTKDLKNVKPMGESCIPRMPCNSNKSQKENKEINKK
ncbi:hypothetical protein [Cetobacterium sp. ZOR0034]|uniref:hypothetical protein n=1 Tax=Cetobacterium sp. ZOR0034 TaxID=1339239 RepID=UPI0012E02814|nr:hypothetical protein [Cetobacterium sp. ZOR0034]